MIAIFPSGFWNAIQQCTRCNRKVGRIVHVHSFLRNFVTTLYSVFSLSIGTHIEVFLTNLVDLTITGLPFTVTSSRIEVNAISDFSKINVDAFYLLIIQYVGQVWILHLTDCAASLGESKEAFEDRWQNRSSACPGQRNSTSSKHYEGGFPEI